MTPEELKVIEATREKDVAVKYIKQPEGSYRCKKCGAMILSVRIAHPVWDGPFPMSGFGKCLYENVLYCPICEGEPSFRGSPVAPKGSYHNP